MDNSGIKLVTKVYSGWIDPADIDELPEEVTESTAIRFGKTKWNPQDVPVTIVVNFPTFTTTR